MHKVPPGTKVFLQGAEVRVASGLSRKPGRTNQIDSARTKQRMAPSGMKSIKGSETNANCFGKVKDFFSYKPTKLYQLWKNKVLGIIF
jgi:hypothetical protein